MKLRGVYIPKLRRISFLGASHRQQTAIVTEFLPRDAVPARYMLSSCVRLSVRPSVRHTPVLYQNG